MQPEKLQKDWFAKCLQEKFQVLDEPDNQFAIQLVGIVEGLKSSRQEVFALLFQGPRQPFMPQGTHKLINNQLGEMDIFLVPVGQDQQGYQYEAVFNNLIPRK